MAAKVASGKPEAAPAAAAKAEPAPVPASTSLTPFRLGDLQLIYGLCFETVPCILALSMSSASLGEALLCRTSPHRQARCVAGYACPDKTFFW